MVRCIWVLTLFLTVSCQEENSTPNVDDRAYYPVQLNNSWTYDFTETIFSVSQETKINKYTYRETLSSLIDPENKLYKVERSLKPVGSSSWASLAPLIIQVKANKITLIDQEIVEDLIVFPIQKGNSWTNGANTKEVVASSDYFLTQGNQVIVESSNDSSAIDLKRDFEVFELNSGIVYKEETDIDFCQENAECIGKGIISSGTKKTYRLIEKTIN